MEIVGNTPSGNAVVGAMLKVTAEDGTIVDNWTSDGTSHKIAGIKEGVTYTLSEIAPPDGYYYAEAVNFKVIDSVVYIVSADGTLTPTGNAIVMYDQVVVTMSTTESTTTTTTTTTTTEIVTDTNTDTNTRPIMSEDTSTTMTTVVTTNILANGELLISKVDLTNGAELPGAILQIIHNGVIVAEWTSTGEPHLIAGLVDSEIYTLKEIKAPESYAIAEEIDFMIYDGNLYIVEDGQNVHVPGDTLVMYDDLAPVTTTSTTTTTTETTTTTTTTTEASRPVMSESVTTTTVTTSRPNMSETTSATTVTTTTTAKKTTTTTKKTTKKGSTSNVTSSPQTNDGIMMLSTAIGSVVVLAAIAAVSKKRKK